MKDICSSHVTSSGEDEDGKGIANQPEDPDGQDRDALQPEAAGGDGDLVVAWPGAAGSFVTLIGIGWSEKKDWTLAPPKEI